MATDTQEPSGIESESAFIDSPYANELQLSAKKLKLATPHLKLTQVILSDATDHNDELVQEKDWLLHPSQSKLSLTGNLFLIEDTLHQSGYILIKCAPLPESRPVPTSGDLTLTHGQDGGTTLFMHESGVEDTWFILPYTCGTLGRAQALQQWQRAQRPETSGHSCPRFLSNTWGNRSRDARMREEFILAEIKAAAKLGVDVVQLDDGWQQGTTANSQNAAEKGGVWEGFWNIDPGFWEVNKEHFPNGLKPVVEQARQEGVQLGLWYAPDSWNDLENWQKDADKILELHRKYDVNHFKVDSIIAKTDSARKNLHALFERVLTISQGEVIFDLDITAGTRPGYLGELSVGPLFVENRYTDWRNYWPHHTLRNLWQLSRWIAPERLRMEFLNNERNIEKYPNDPLAPAHYSADTLFATVMFSNPLGWFECSSLSAAYLSAATPLIQIWKRHREAIFGGTIIPVGKEPDGLNYTGFMSIADGGDKGYALLFREQNPKDHASIETPADIDLESAHWEILSSQGSITSKDNRLSVHITHPLGYTFARFSMRS